MKTWVKILGADHQYGDYKDGEIGYIDGYVRGGEDCPYAVVVIKNRVVLVSLHNLLAIELK